MAPTIPSVADPFKISSIKAAKRFLQTAMLFDDNATFTAPVTVKPVVLITPPSDEPEELEDIPEAKSEPTKDEVKNSQTPNPGENLYAKLINDAFAKEGIVCGVIKPVREDPTAIAAIKNAAKRTDIVVVDWSIDNDQGATAMSLIESILKDDQNDDSQDNKGRLRLLAIYTFDPGLADIAEEIKNRFGFKPTGEDVKGQYTLALDNNVRLCIYQKDRGSAAYYGPDRERVVADDKLPEKLIGDFSDMTSGLLFNLVLTALGAIRENTHRLIQRFSATMDAPYFTHRVLSPHVDDTQAHPINLLTSEIEDILLDCVVSEEVNSKSINDWLDKISNDRDLTWNGISKADILQSLKALSAVGIEKYFETNQASLPATLKALYKKLVAGEDRNSAMTSMLIGNNAKANEYDRDFAILTSFRSHYVQPPPQLTLGAVLGRKNDMNGWDYLICIQPVCDATRLGVGIPHSFPFLRLIDPTRAAPPKPVFNLTFVHRKETRRLKIAVKPSQIVLHSFNGNCSNETVVATRHKDIVVDNPDYWTFTTTDDVSYEWIGELRFPQAQRVAVNLAAELSRVGLTESEWLRRAIKGSN
jgi:hypothetical protein